jgi:hypothetical protein
MAAPGHDTVQPVSTNAADVLELGIQMVGVVRLEMESGNVVFNQRACPARIWDESRHSGCHGLNDGKAKRLHWAEVDEKIGLGKALIHTGLEALERDV